MLSILVVNTIIQMGPLVFLTQAEKLDGEFDAIFSDWENGIYEPFNYNYYESQGIFYNYTQVHGLQPETNFAPRKLMANSHVSNQTTSSTELSFKLTLIMTDLEKQLEIGASYPFGPLSTGQCLISKNIQESRNITVKSEIIISVKTPYTLIAVAEEYNRIAPAN